MVTDVILLTFSVCLHTYIIKYAIIYNNLLGFNVEYITNFDRNFDLYDKETYEKNIISFEDILKNK